MSKDNVMSLYDVIHRSCDTLMSELQVSYLEALAETMQNLVDNQTAQQVDGLPNDDTVLALNTLYHSVSLKSVDVKDIRKAIQLALLQAIKIDNIQANLHITPDSIAYFISFLIDTLVTGTVQLLDVTAGSGNLVCVIAEQLKEKIKQVHACEVDDILTAILAMSTQLQHINCTTYHQDAVLPLLVDAPNVVVSDLPIGFYPNDDKVSSFHVAVNNNHTFAHHALIENSLAVLQPNGWGIYIVPANLFETNQSPQILQLLTKNNYYLQGFLTLPSSLFKSQSSQKAILLVQKQGDLAKKSDAVLLKELPSFKDVVSFKKFMQSFQEWARDLAV